MPPPRPEPRHAVVFLREKDHGPRDDVDHASNERLDDSWPELSVAVAVGNSAAGTTMVRSMLKKKGSAAVECSPTFGTVQRH